MVISVAKSAVGATLTPPVDAAIEAPDGAGRRQEILDLPVAAQAHDRNFCAIL